MINYMKGMRRIFMDLYTIRAKNGCKFRKKLTLENRNTLKVAIALFVIRTIDVAKILYSKEIQTGTIRFVLERYEDDGGCNVLS